VWLPLLPPAEQERGPGGGASRRLGARREGGAAGSAQRWLIRCMRVAAGPLEQARCRELAGRGAGAGWPGSGVGPPVHFQLRWLDEWAIEDFLEQR
jgi:hypothetical protein